MQFSANSKQHISHYTLPPVFQDFLYELRKLRLQRFGPYGPLCISYVSQDWHVLGCHTKALGTLNFKERLQCKPNPIWNY